MKYMWRNQGIQDDSEYWKEVSWEGPQKIVYKINGEEMDLSIAQFFELIDSRINPGEKHELVVENYTQESVVEIIERLLTLNTRRRVEMFFHNTFNDGNDIAFLLESKLGEMLEGVCEMISVENMGREDVCNLDIILKGYAFGEFK